MRAQTTGAILALMAACAGANAQTGVLYKLQTGSELEIELCLPPCACPSHMVRGPLDGTFTLTKVAQNPLFTTYTVTSAVWVASIPFAATHVRGQGTYRIGGEVALQHEMNLMLAVSVAPTNDPVPFTSGLVIVDPANPFPRIGIEAVTDAVGCSRYTVRLIAAPLPCQADCDASGTLTSNDFMCFLNKFAAGDPYANCDGSSVAPVLTANDFVCYLNTYAAGCD